MKKAQRKEPRQEPLSYGHRTKKYTKHKPYKSVYLARRDTRAKAEKSGDSLLTNVESRAADVVLVDLLEEDGGQHADDDLLLLLCLGEGMIKTI